MGSEVKHEDVHELIIEGAEAIYEVKEVFHQGKSEFQDIEVVDLASFGRTLLLDGKIQSTAGDEFIYHESLCYPALLFHPNPKKVLILGGGEGGTARESLRFKSVEKVVMVDIDKVVVDTSKEFLTTYHRGAWDNPRLEVVIGCAKEFLEKTEEKWDVIIGDLADPVAGNPCYMLYTTEFYQMLMTKLSPDGIFVTQSGPTGIFCVDDVCFPIVNTLEGVFKHVKLYHNSCPAFFDHYGFTLASNAIDFNKVLAESNIEQLIEDRVDATHEEGAKPTDKGNNAPLSLDDETIRAHFIIPKWMKEMKKKNKTVISNDAFVYLK